LSRIRTDVMTPLLKNGQTAEGIAAGLQMVASDLRYGPPPPPAYRSASAAVGRIPFNVLAALYAGVVALLVVRLTRRAPLGGEAGLQPPAAPGDLSPAMAGALLKGRVSDTQIEATVLDFARRGLLVIEPTRIDKVDVRLLGDGEGLTGYEREVWEGLSSQARGSERTLTSEDLAELRKSWDGPRTVLRRELVERGWYDPEGASARRRPLYVAAVLGGVGASLAILLCVLSQEVWAGIGLLLFLGAASAALIRAYAVPDTTVEGELAAAPWRAYRETVAAHTYEPNLDADLPYIVALGLVARLTPRLKAASERGYAPSWFQGAEGRQPAAAGFYPYWIVFHSSMSPVSTASGSASGGYSGGGAAGGGGGSAGGF
jgi:uncharacterized membrane protein YgcG